MICATKPVVTADGHEIKADYIVLSPGASNGGIFKPADEGIDAFLAAQSRTEQQIRDSDTIVIVGAGAVGTELAGEIAHHYPDKSVSLVSADPGLFPGFPAKLGKGLERGLKKLGVGVILGQRVNDLQSTTQPYSGTVTLSDGRTINADLVIPAIGSRPQTALFDPLPDVVKAPDGRVEVDVTLCTFQPIEAPLSVELKSLESGPELSNLGGRLRVGFGA